MRNSSAGRNSAVGIATRQQGDGPGIERRLEARFSAPVQTGPGAQPAAIKWVKVSFSGVKRPQHDVDHPPHLEPRLKKEYSYTSTPS